MDPYGKLEVVDRYLRNEMGGEERTQFEELRKQDQELDQMVVEHHYFLEQMGIYADRKRFKYDLQDIHHTLSESGEIKVLQPDSKGKVIALWNRYRRVVAVAASIAGITALLTTGLAAIFSPKAPISEIEELRRKVTKLEKQTSNQGAVINAVRNKIDPATPIKFGGSGFLIDTKGYLVTSAHVVEDASGIFVQNNKGQDFRAQIVHRDLERDLAVLKIEDEDYRSHGPLPYGFSRSNTDIAEPVFTLGYPKDEIVYGEGYLSARTGLKGDTLAYQLSISANPGNSGGPVLNRRGEVIGILNARQTEAEGVVFAVKARNIFRVVDEINKKGDSGMIRLNGGSSIRSFDRVQQVRKIQDCVYMVKVIL